MHLLGRDHAERIGEGEMRVGIRVEQDDPEPVRGGGRQDHREKRCPTRRHRSAIEPRPAVIGKSAIQVAMRRQQLFAASAQSVPCPDRRHARACPGRRRSPTACATGATACCGLPGRSRRAGLARSTMLRSWLPGTISMPLVKLGIGASASRNSAHSVERPASVMSPVMRTRSIGSARWMVVEPAPGRAQALIAARPGRPLSMRKPKRLADHMKVREMGHPKAPAGRRRRGEGRDVVRAARGRASVRPQTAKRRPDRRQ